MSKTEKDNPYSKTVLLPETNFAMKGDLAKREPAQIQEWKKNQTFRKMVEKRGNKPKFVLHDGPPYANGNFHLGHALNKILKDIIIKSKNLSGFQADMIPGWDCHGLPIEVQVLKNLGKEAKQITPTALRKACRDYASQYVTKQGMDLDSFLCFWEEGRIYETMSPSFEAKIVEVFGALFEAGYIYKGKKPVYWCIDLATAHAEAEIEYAPHVSPSIYVKFPTKGAENEFCLIWTTTPWTLPANLAICFNPEIEYVVASSDHGNLIVAKELIPNITEKTGIKLTSIKAIGREELSKKVFLHPFLDRDSISLFGNHVTLEAGTGCVHTAPGHGTDDYRVGLEAGLPAFSPVDDRGKYTEEFPMMQGTKIWDANPKIIDLLEQKGLLLHHSEYQHSYPHSWRSKKPLIFRATPQWFFSIDAKDLREKSLAAIPEVKWIPDWGISRIESMVSNRPDWCLSRQRNWGVPIPSFTCQSCGEVHLESEAISHFISLVKQKGIEIWYDNDAKEILPPNTKCFRCGSSDLKQDRDILDVWFDSGVSNFAVYGDSKDDPPADLYLEGSDQHRGWFQSSLWPSMALRGFPPYKSVLTHGYTLDDQGRAMSKSLGNGIEPKEVIQQFGADVLRLWISSQDFRDDLRLTKDGTKLTGENYRKIRNTFRYLLGNCQKTKENNLDLDIIDKVFLGKTSELCKEVKEHYNNYQFHLVAQKLLLFVSKTLSQEYFEIIRDRMYCESKDSLERKSSSFTLRVICETLSILSAPILSFTAEEVWKELGHKESVFFEDFPSLENYMEFSKALETCFQIKEEVQKTLEVARSKGEIGKSLEAKVVLNGIGIPEGIATDLWENLLVVSQVEVVRSSNSLQISVLRAKEPPCPRCWRHVRELKEENQLCHRCNSVVSTI